MPKPTHILLSRDELHDTCLDALSAFVINTQRGIDPRAAALAAVDLAVFNASERYDQKVARDYLRAVGQ